MEDLVLNQIRERCMPCYRGNAHGWDHACRVAAMARRFAAQQGEDPKAAEALGYLHDMERHREELGQVACHAQAGAIQSEHLLAELKVEPRLALNMVRAVAMHRVSLKMEPQSALAAILQDADRLDALGAIAVARIFANAGCQGTPFHDPSLLPGSSYDGTSSTAINHFHEKILQLTPETFHTSMARQVAMDRYAFISEYVRRFLEEWG